MTDRELIQQAQPCPFCGDADVSVVQGDTYRWVLVECNNCGARAGEVRKTIGAGTPELWRSNAERDAIEAWNTRARLAQPEPDAYGYATRLAEAIYQKHYKEDSPEWRPLDTTLGVLTQIDNMTCRLVKTQPEPEPVAWVQSDFWNHLETFNCGTAYRIEDDDRQPLYTAPPQRDGIALSTGFHPRGKRVDDDAQISEDALEIVEIEAPVEIEDKYVKDYLWEHNLVAIDEGDLRKLMPSRRLLAAPALMEQAGWVRKREWQGLTDEEAEEVAKSVGYNPLVMTVYEYRVAVQRATEAKLKEKNT